MKYFQLQIRLEIFKRMLRNVWSTQLDIRLPHVCADTTVRTGCILCFCLNGRETDSSIRIGVIILSCQLESTGEKPVASVVGRMNFMFERFKLLLLFVLRAALLVCPCFFAIKFQHFKASLDWTLPNPPFTVNIPTVFSGHEIEEKCDVMAVP